MSDSTSILDLPTDPVGGENVNNNIRYYTEEESRINEIDIEQYMGHNNEYVYDDKYKMVYVVENNKDSEVRIVNKEVLKYLGRHHYLNNFGVELSECQKTKNQIWELPVL